MKDYESRFKIVYSTPARFVLFGLPFGILIESSTKPFLWVDVAIKGSTFGLIMVILTRKWMSEYILQSSSTDQYLRSALNDAIRTGILPADKKILELFPSSLSKRHESVEKAAKQGLPIILLFSSAFFLLAILNHSWPTGILALLFLTTGITLYSTLKRTLKRIDVLRAHL